MDITQTILNEKKVDQYVIKMTGNLFKIDFNMIHYGDWLSYGVQSHIILIQVQLVKLIDWKRT